MTTLTTINIIKFVGELWEPGFKTAGTMRVTDEDLAEIGELTRYNIHNWIKSKQPDCAVILDFDVCFMTENFYSPWEYTASFDIYWDVEFAGCPDELDD